MKKMNNGIFRQIRMAAFACAGTARAKDVRVYYQVATKLDENADFSSSDSAETQKETLSYRCGGEIY